MQQLGRTSRITAKEIYFQSNLVNKGSRYLEIILQISKIRIQSFTILLPLIILDSGNLKWTLPKLETEIENFEANEDNEQQILDGFEEIQSFVNMTPSPELSIMLEQVILKF